MNTFTNELHDIAQEEAFSMGFDALHVRPPDEVVMEMEEYVADDDADDRVRCVLTILRVLTYNVQSLDDIVRRVAKLCAEMLPWHKKMVPVHFMATAHERNRSKASAYKVTRQMLVDWHAPTASMLLGMVTDDFQNWTAREVGKRVLITLYASVADQRLRPEMAKSLSAIGAELGLTAKNKRSAISAAIKSHVLPMFRKMSAARSGRPASECDFKLWFMKNKHCREALSVAMKGKQNRKKKGQKAESGERRAESLRQGDPETGRHAEA